MEATLDSDDTVRLALASAEALVLFEWLHRNEDQDVRLESTLVDPFRSDYLDVVERARASLRAVEGDA